MTLGDARLADVRSIIAKRARDLNKAPDQLTDDEIAEPIRRKRGKAGGVSRAEQDTLGVVEGRAAKRPKYAAYAKDGSGRRIGFNPKTKKWEPVK